MPSTRKICEAKSKGPSSGSLVNKGREVLSKLPDEGPSPETSKILSYFSGRSIPTAKIFTTSLPTLAAVVNEGQSLY